MHKYMYVRTHIHSVYAIDYKIGHYWNTMHYTTLMGHAIEPASPHTTFTMKLIIRVLEKWRKNACTLQQVTRLDSAQCYTVRIYTCIIHVYTCI